MGTESLCIIFVGTSGFRLHRLPSDETEGLFISSKVNGFQDLSECRQKIVPNKAPFFSDY